MEELRAAHDAAATTLQLVGLDTRARACLWLPGWRGLFWVRSNTAFVFRRAGDEYSLPFVSFAGSAAADAVLAKWSLIAALFSRRVSCFSYNLVLVVSLALFLISGIVIILHLRFFLFLYLIRAEQRH